MNSDDASPRRRRRMERLARAAEGWGRKGAINSDIVRRFGMLALAARRGGGGTAGPADADDGGGG